MDADGGAGYTDARGLVVGKYGCSSTPRRFDVARSPGKSAYFSGYVRPSAAVSIGVNRSTQIMTPQMVSSDRGNCPLRH